MGATKDMMIDEMFPPKTEEEMNKEDDEWNDMMFDLPTFVSSDTFKVPRGHAFVVKLDRTTYDFEHIIGKEIVINGKSYIGLDVSKYANVPPWHIGSPIAILARRNFMKTSVATSNIIRWLIGCALLFGVYSETGGWTTFVIFLLFLNDEARRFTKNMQQKFMAKRDEWTSNKSEEKEGH